MENKPSEESTTPSNTTPIPTTPTIQSVNHYNSVSSFSQVASSSLLSIRVRLVDFNIVKTLQFNPNTLVFDALKIIREKIPEINNNSTGIKCEINIFKNSIVLLFIFFY